MAQTSLLTRDTPRWLPDDDAAFQRDWRIEHHLVRARWGIAIVWLILIPFIPTVSIPSMLAVVAVYGTGNAVLWRLVGSRPGSQGLSTAQRLTTVLEWASATGALAAVADRLALVLPGGLLILMMLTGLRFRLLGVFVGTTLASVITVGSFIWHAGIREDVLRETAIDAAVVWVVVLHVMGVLLGVVINESDRARWHRALRWETERLDAERRSEDQRQASLGALEQEQARREAALEEAAMRCDLALSELAAQRDSIIAEIKAQLGSAHTELSIYQRKLRKLSEREETILRLLPQAELSYADIGLQTCLTESSVKTYVHRIGVKLGLDGKITRAAVVATAYSCGMLGTPNSGTTDASDSSASVSG